VLHAAGRLAQWQADYAGADTLLQRSLALYRNLEDRRGVADVLMTQGTVVRAQNELERARELFVEGLALYRELGEAPGCGLALCHLGVTAWQQGDNAQAQRLLDESVALDTRYRAFACTMLGHVALAQGEVEHAAALFKEGLTRGSQASGWLVSALSLLGLAAVGMWRGTAAPATRLLGAVEALSETLGAPLIPPSGRGHYELVVARLRAQLDAEAFAAAWAEGRSLSLDQAIAAAFEMIAHGDDA
jgi:tetratricopeptide (TPR) repeat protein